MRRYLFILVALALTPSAVSAMYIEHGGQTLLKNTPSEENIYLTGTDITVTGASDADVSAAGASLHILGPVGGDVLLGGGTLTLRAPVAGDARLIGLRITATEHVAGDFVAAGLHVETLQSLQNAWILGGTVRVLGGAEGPVTIYGSRVVLRGSFAGNVRVLATDTLTLEEGTHIAGTLKYNAPQEARIASSATIAGGVEYTGKSFLPTTDEARMFAFFSAGIFLLVRLLAALIAVGLFAGLFPRFSAQVIEQTLSVSASRFVLTILLGLSVVVVTPVVVLLLLISVAGIGVGLFVGAAYLLTLLIGYAGAGIIAGSVLARKLLNREHFSWRHAVLGMAALYAIGVIPVLGAATFFALVCAAIGAATLTAYRSAFQTHDEEGE